MRPPALTLAALLTTTGLGPLAAQAPVPGSEPGSPRERIWINDGWRFVKGDPPGDTTSLLYDVILKPLPHDWAIEGPFDPAGGEREAFNGLALAIVRTRPGETGRITLTAASTGLRSGVSYITVVH